jgi:hypothetical protein
MIRTQNFPTWFFSLYTIQTKKVWNNQPKAKMKMNKTRKTLKMRMMKKTKKNNKGKLKMQGSRNR